MRVVNALVKRQQPLAPRIAKTAHSEEVLDRGEQREVVVFAHDVDAAWLRVLRDQEQPDTPAADRGARAGRRGAGIARSARRAGRCRAWVEEEWFFSFICDEMTIGTKAIETAA